MKSKVFWTKEKYSGRIALVSRPRGGDWLEDETVGWADAGLDVIVTMLDAEETKSFELEHEAEFCALNGIEFVSFSIADRSVPAADERFFRLLEKLKTLLLQGKNIGIHCRQSIGSLSSIKCCARRRSSRNNRTKQMGGTICRRTSNGFILKI